jgi:hypothetical protein
MSEDTVMEVAHVYKDAVKVEGSVEIRKPAGSTSGFQTSRKASSTTG